MGTRWKNSPKKLTLPLSEKEFKPAEVQSVQEVPAFLDQRGGRRPKMIAPDDDADDAG